MNRGTRSLFQFRESLTVGDLVDRGLRRPAIQCFDCFEAGDMAISSLPREMQVKNVEDIILCRHCGGNRMRLDCRPRSFYEKLAA
jgi:hypothetical protein